MIWLAITAALLGLLPLVGYALCVLLPWDSTTCMYCVHLLSVRNAAQSLSVCIHVHTLCIHYCTYICITCTSFVQLCAIVTPYAIYGYIDFLHYSLSNACLLLKGIKLLWQRIVFLVFCRPWTKYLLVQIISMTYLM